ncbi:hypothetical protein BDN70DRAFT_877190 [Pholiota conissans]|uniref:Cyanovirin-N domain-containing protein n=1 Tax=Pholiota conissans TaxID=109636 RepID=A0A9P5Z429_9AGAR|nr:hypothetical protein BDN70DRAFT_877190 [Pholiota conissans]
MPSPKGSLRALSFLPSLLLIFLLLLISLPLATAQIWDNFSGSCSSWEGRFGTTDGTHGTAVLSATCSSASGAQVQSSLDLNTCIGRQGLTATFMWPSSGMFDTCIVLNVPNSMYNPYSADYSNTELSISCIADQNGGVFILGPFDMNMFVGSNNGNLICGFM